MQNRAATHRMGDEENSAKLTALQSRCDAADLALEKAERTLAEVASNLEVERRRAASRIAAVHDEYRARERETERQVQDTIEHGLRLGTASNKVVRFGQRSPAGSVNEKESAGETQSVISLRAEAVGVLRRGRTRRRLRRVVIRFAELHKE